MLGRWKLSLKIHEGEQGHLKTTIEELNTDHENYRQRLFKYLSVIEVYKNVIEGPIVLTSPSRPP